MAEFAIMTLFEGQTIDTLEGCQIARVEHRRGAVQVWIYVEDGQRGSYTIRDKDGEVEMYCRAVGTHAARAPGGDGQSE